MKKKQHQGLKRDEMENFGSLITIKNSDGHCLGNLISFQSSVFDAYYGEVEVTPEEVTAHNAALDKAFIDGLDDNCEVGQRGTFYYDEKKNIVQTFSGTMVATARVVGKTITFCRKGKLFRGRLQKDADSFNFMRIK